MSLFAFWSKPICFFAYYVVLRCLLSLARSTRRRRRPLFLRDRKRKKMRKRPCHSTISSSPQPPLLDETSSVSCSGVSETRSQRRCRSLSLLLPALLVIVSLGRAAAFTTSRSIVVSNHRISRTRRPTGTIRGGNNVLLASTVVPSADHDQRSDPATATAAGAAVDPSNLPSIANHILHHTRNLDDLYDKSSAIRCPFLRRRAADAIDGIAMILRFLVIRHKSLGIFDPLKMLLLDDISSGEELLKSNVKPPGWKAIGKHVRKNADGTICKNRHLPLSTIASTIAGDWQRGPNAVKGYYLTGRLNSTIYTDDCLFDGPDPDMPVRGLRKYLSAASHLFERESSFAQLLDLRTHEVGGKNNHGMVEVKWKLGGTLMLPWRPSVKPWTGTTRYHLDEDGLIYLHEEEWDITVMEAFVCTVFPKLGERIWGVAAGSMNSGTASVGAGAGAGEQS